MTTNPCKQYRAQLIDFADGMLVGESHQKVAKHVDRCAACRQEVETLQYSLELTQSIWQENLVRGAGESPIKSRGKAWPLAVAASLVLLLGLAWLIRRPQPSASPTLSLAQIEQKLETEASAARLLASAEILSSQPQGTELSKSQYQYILNHYPATRAGKQARAKLQKF